LLLARKLSTLFCKKAIPAEGGIMVSRLLFLCARGSSRALLAASILEALAERHWDVWSTPTQDEQGRVLAEQVLHEQGIPLLASDHFIEPTFGMQWDEGIVLCSGAAET
jgi:protein-tyrosine-phosphatase